MLQDKPQKKQKKKNKTQSAVHKYHPVAVIGVTSF